MPRSTGFYEAVVQQVRPWAPNAPQLPGGGRTAAEEAGIDIERPDQDLLEPSEPELTGDVPPDTAPPAVVAEGVAAVREDASVPAERGLTRRPIPLADPPDERREVGGDEMVSSEAAHDKLDHKPAPEGDSD